MSAEVTLPLTPGELVAGKFLVDRVLGVGGMGAVFAAVDQVTGGHVAIKCLLPIFADNKDVRTRFLREGSATMRLKSEHIAQVSSTGTLDDGVPFIVMEHLDGRDLRTVVRGSGPLDVSTAAAYVGQVCHALAEAHALGIIHRDLKPANLFLTRRPNGAALIKVLDFGIAKYTSASLLGDQAEMTKTQAVLGSRAYMSPEQMLRPRDVDARADIWSLGVILYFFVTGKNPFTSDTTEGMIMRIVSGAAEPLQTAFPDVPAAFDAVVMRCLSKRREDRFSNVTELARALAPLASHLPDRATMELDDSLPPRAIQAAEPSGPTMRGYSVPDPSQPGVSQMGPTRPSGSRTSLTRVNRRSLATLVGSLGALLIAGIVVVSFIVSTRNATAHTEDALVPVAAQSPVPVPVSVPVPVPVPVPEPVAVIEDPRPAPPPSASIVRASPSSPITPPPSAKPTFTKGTGAKPGGAHKASNPAADTPW